MTTETKAPVTTTTTSGDLLAAVVQVSPSEAMVAKKKPYMVALKPSAPLIDLMLGGINFPKETGYWDAHNQFHTKQGQIAYLTDAEVARVLDVIRRSFLRHNYMQGVFNADGSPKIMGTVRVETAPRGVANNVMVLPTDVPIKEFLIFREVALSTDKIADDEAAQMEVANALRTAVMEEEAKDASPDAQKARKVKASLAAGAAKSAAANAGMTAGRLD